MWSIVLRYLNGTLVTINECTLPILKTGRLEEAKVLLWKISSHTHFIADEVALIKLALIKLEQQMSMVTYAGWFNFLGLKVTKRETYWYLMF